MFLPFVVVDNLMFFLKLVNSISDEDIFVENALNLPDMEG